MKHYYITTNYSQNQQMAVQQDHSYTEMITNILDHPNSIESNIYRKYAKDFKTTICLGVSQPTELIALYSYMRYHKEELQIPMGFFQEDSLNKTMTSLTFITNEKLSYNIYGMIAQLLRENKIYSLYSIKKEMILSNHSNSFILSIKIEEDKPVFYVEFKNRLFKSFQNEDMMEIDFSDDKIEEIYKKYNEEDYCFHQGIEFEDEFDEITVKEKYSFVEMEFLRRIRSLNLK
ncbi:MAG: hypothetical protein CL760_07155 [Chloroflexi bacterium]|nr:hypothetical protein [Chloroflexota bacterium]